MIVAAIVMLVALMAFAVAVGGWPFVATVVVVGAREVLR